MHIDNSLNKSFLISAQITILIWAFFILDIVIPYDITQLGIVPRTFSHIPGIFLMPVLHGSFAHIFSNSITLFCVIAMLFYIYPKISKKVFIQSWLLTGVYVWLFAGIISKTGNHIGASGLVYALISFLFFIGLFSRQLIPLTLSVIIIFLYGSLFFGIIPTFMRPNISWESHLIGSIIGLVLAWRNRHQTIYHLSNI